MTIRPLSAPPSRQPAKPAAPPAAAPTAPRDIPPELRLAPPEPPEPPTSTMRKVGLHVALGLSVLGVAGPLAHQAIQGSRAAKAAEALRSTARPAEVRADVPAALLPASEVPASWGSLSPDGRHLLVGLNDRSGSLAVVNAADGRALARIDDATSGVFLSPTHLATWNRNGGLQLRDLDGKVLAADPVANLADLATSPAGDRVAWTDAKGLTLLPLQGPALQLPDVKGRITSWSADGSRLTVLRGGYYASETSVQVVDARAGRVLFERDLEGEDGTVRLSPDGQSVLTAGGRRDSRWGGHVRMLGVDGSTAWERRGFASAAFSPDGRKVALADWDRGVEVVEARTGRPLWKAPAGGHEVRFSPDGGRIGVATRDALMVHDAGTGAHLWAHQVGDSVNWAFSPDGKVAVGQWLQKGQNWIVSLLDGATGTVVAQQPAAGRLQPLAFSRDGGVLLIQGEQGWNHAHVQLVDVARSPYDRGAAARQEAREILARLGAPAVDGLDTLPVDVLRALEAGGRRMVAGPPRPAALDVKATFADPAALRAAADRAFAQADARYAERLGNVEKRLLEARQSARQKGVTSAPLGELLAGNLDPTSFDPDVQRIMREGALVRQERDVEAWSMLAGTPLEPAAGTANQPVTLEALARAHGAGTPQETKRFADLTLALNGGRVEKAQEAWLEAVRQLYPEAPAVPVERQPFVPSGVDLVLPAYHHHDGTFVSSRDMGALKAWQEGSRAVLLDGGTVVLGEGGAWREAVGRAYEEVLRERDPDFYEGFSRRWREDWWHSQRWQGREVDDFGAQFAQFTGPGRAEFEAKSPRTARLVQIAVDAAPRVAK